jgi:anti-sigma regulatory factor (Ser/Thr protein kinase)
VSSSVPATPDAPSTRDLAHVALLYDTEDDYAAVVTRFLRGAVEDGRAALAAVPPGRITLLRDTLGPDAARVEFADMTEVGRNPAWIIPRVLTFTGKNRDQRVRYVGEPIWAERGAAELREATRHESLINLALADADADILCPYDVRALTPEVVADAARTHPLLLSGGRLDASPGYTGPLTVPVSCDRPLPSPPHDAMPFIYRSDLRAVRIFVREHAAAAGLTEARANDLVLAVSEVAANTLRHTQSHGTLWIWYDTDEIVCEVRDDGVISDPLAGRRPPGLDSDGGHGLWLVNQLCDLVELRSGSDGTMIRMHMAIRPPRRLD